MAGVPYSRLREVLTLLASGAPRDQYRVSTAIDSEDCWLGVWANDGVYVLVQAAVAEPALNRSLIDVHAGAAYGMQPSRELFQTLATASWRFDYGGPWSRVRQDGTAFGWRSRLPSELFSEGNLSDAFGFVLGMVDAFGQACNVLADELIPRFGGTRCRDYDPNSWPALLSGMLPPDTTGQQ